MCKDLILLVVVIVAVIALPLFLFVYWLLNPELTGAQMILKFWYLYITIFIMAIILSITGYFIDD